MKVDNYNYGYKMKEFGTPKIKKNRLCQSQVQFNYNAYIQDNRRGVWEVEKKNLSIFTFICVTITAIGEHDSPFFSRKRPNWNFSSLMMKTYCISGYGRYHVGNIICTLYKYKTVHAIDSSIQPLQTLTFLSIVFYYVWKKCCRV